MKNPFEGWFGEKKEESKDDETLAYIKKLESQGITDKDVAIDSIEGVNETERVGGADTPQRSYAGGKKQ